MKNAWIDNRRARGTARRSRAAGRQRRTSGGFPGRYAVREPVVGVGSDEQTTRGAAAGGRAGAGRRPVLQGGGRSAGDSHGHAHQPARARAHGARRGTGGKEIRRELRRRNPDGLRRRRARREAARAKSPPPSRRIRRWRAASSSIARCAPRSPARSRRCWISPFPSGSRAARAGDADAATCCNFPRGRRARRPRPGARASGRRWLRACVLGALISWRLLAPGDARRSSRAKTRWWRAANWRARSTPARQRAARRRAGADRPHLQGARRQLLPQLRDARDSNGRAGVPRRRRLAGAGRRIHRCRRQGRLQQASSALPPAILRAIEARGDGAALDAEAERSAQLAGWKVAQ